MPKAALHPASDERGRTLSRPRLPVGRPKKPRKPAPLWAAEGEVLRRWRQQRGLSQLALADASSLSCATIGSFERGQTRMTDRALVRLCSALEVSPHKLCIEMARARAEKIAPLVAQGGGGEGEEWRAAELDWALGVVFPALQAIVVRMAGGLWSLDFEGAGK